MKKSKLKLKLLKKQNKVLKAEFQELKRISVVNKEKCNCISISIIKPAEISNISKPKYKCRFCDKIWHSR